MKQLWYGFLKGTYCLLLFNYFLLVSTQVITAYESSDNEISRAFVCPACPITGPVATFCNIKVTDQICVSGNAQVGGDLTVCGTIIASGFTGSGGQGPTGATGATGATGVTGPTGGNLSDRNYVFDFDTRTQTYGGGTFQNITFNSTGIIDGWVHSVLPPGVGTAQFTCSQTGLYLIEYDIITRKIGGPAGTFSSIATLNGVEIPGSQAAVFIAVNNEPLEHTRAFFANINAGDVLTFQFKGDPAGTAGNFQILANGGSGTTRPGITITITRIA